MSGLDPTYDDKILKAAVEAEARPSPDDTFSISSGVVLKALRVAPLRIDAIQRQFKDPEVPVVTLPDGRKLDNPDDPDYDKALKAVELERSLAMADALMMFGTEFVSAPAGMLKPDEDSWVEEMSFVGVHVPDHPKARYLAWLRYVALEGNVEQDLVTITTNVMRKMSISEENIAQAMDSFRGEAVGRADSPVLSKTAGNGHNN